jgi:hypothetical protein
MTYKFLNITHGYKHRIYSSGGKHQKGERMEVFKIEYMRERHV